MAIGQSPGSGLVNNKILMTQIQQDEIIPQAMHFVKRYRHTQRAKSAARSVFLLLILFLFIGGRGLFSCRFFIRKVKRALVTASTQEGSKQNKQYYFCSGHRYANPD
jgi:hypothetical protein